MSMQPNKPSHHHRHHNQQLHQQETMLLENKLLNYENRFKSLYQHMQNGFALHEIITDSGTGEPVDYRYLEVNEAFEEMTGLTKADIIGKRVTDVLPGIQNEAANWIGRYGKVALGGTEGGGVVDRFEQYSSKSNKWYMGLAFCPNKNEFVTLFLDITKRKAMEEKLRQSEERHRTLFESMIQGVVYQAADGQIITANPSAERILGLTLDQMMGKTSVDPSWRSIHEDGSDYPGNAHPSMMALATGKPVTGAIMGVYHPQKKSHHWITIDAIPLFKPGETKPFQVYTTFTDITERKNFEREIIRAKNKAEEADKLKSAFLANMSHEIRTPLNGIIGHIDLALASGLCTESRQENLEGLEVARESGRLLVSIINDILDLSKIEAGQLKVQKRPFNLQKMIDQTMSVGNMLITQRTKNKQLKLEYHTSPNINDTIAGDDYRIQQVVHNLTSNAIKFTEMGSVHLNVDFLKKKNDDDDDDEGKCNNTLEFCIKDTGKGMSQDQLDVIFEPFRQVDFSDTRKHGGTGLGLTISKKLVELMGGTLTVESSIDPENHGTTFRFTLPYEPAAASSSKQQQQNTQKKKVVEDRPYNNLTVMGKRKILVAEDDPVSRKVACKMLEKAGYQDIITAEDGKEAVAKFESDKSIDLILMDVQMPHMDGLEATGRIRKLEESEEDNNNNNRSNKRQRRVPIIALSAAAMSGDRERGVAVGMTDYLTKPVNRKDLLDTLGQYLGCGGSASSSPTKIGCVTGDVECKRSIDPPTLGELGPGCA